MEVAHSHLERRWQTIGGWIIAAIAFVWYFGAVFLYVEPIGNVFSFHGVQLVVIAAVVVVTVRTARRFYVGFKAAGHRHLWVLHYDRRNTRQVGDFVAGVSNAIASR